MMFIENHQYHNIGFPAIITFHNLVSDTKFNRINKIYEISYYVNGDLHNEDGPALIRYDEEGKISLVEFYEHGELSRTPLPGNESKPSKYQFEEDGRLEWYYQKGKLYRSFDGKQKPSLIQYFDNNTISQEAYYFNDMLHRKDGPAVIEYYPDGKIKSEEYWLEGEKIK